MELAIPLVALGGMYVISNTNSTSNKPPLPTVKKNAENFENMGKPRNYLPNTRPPVENYPTTKTSELVDTVEQYPNPNVATDKYFNQNAYENKERAGGEVGSNIQDIYSLSGEYMNSDQFRHNNMVPFNGKKPHGQIYNNNNAETVLDNYVGNGSQFVKKIEQAPLFSPQDNVQWTHGTPNMSDFYQSRVNPAMRNNMVKPFETERVGPGLNKGYTTDGSGGYNSGMEARDKWLPKTVDELRVATNPKEEYSLENHQGPAQSSIKNTGIIGKVEKYAPDTFFVNSQDRWLTTTGAEKGPRSIAKEVVKPSHRNDTTTHITGTPNPTLKTAGYVPSRHEDAKRPELGVADVPHSRATGRGPISDGEKNIKSHTNYENTRTVNCQPDTFRSGFGGAIGAAIAPIMDMMRPSRKEEYVCNMRSGNLGATVSDGYVLNAADAPGTTIKETTIYQPAGYINNQGNSGGAYETSTHQPINNQRDTTNYSAYGGVGGAASHHGNRQYDADYRRTTNATKEKTLVSRTNQGNGSLFNGDINVSSMAKNDCDRENNRLWAPSATIPGWPSANTYGHIDMPQRNDGNSQGCDRLDGRLLDAFKSNPYTHSLTSTA